MKNHVFLVYNGFLSRHISRINSTTVVGFDPPTPFWAPGGGEVKLVHPWVPEGATPGFQKVLPLNNIRPPLELHLKS